MTRRSRFVVLGALVAAGITIPALLFVARYPRWWEWIAPEQVPMTWFQSVTLVVAGVISLIAWFVCRLLDRTPRAGLALLSLGFAALAFDERFAIHERVRDGVLAPRDISLPLLTWIAPGDFVLVLVAVAGLLFLPTVLRCLRGDRWAFGLFLLGVVLALVSVGTDSIDPGTWSVETERVQQSLEECIELWAALAFLGGLTFRLMGLLADVATPVEVDDREDDVERPARVTESTPV